MVRGSLRFTTREGELNLAYWSDEDAAMCRYVVVPTTTKILQSLRRGEISVYDALNQPRCWLCDLTHQGEFVACQRVDFESIPKDSLPAIGTMLLAALEPQSVDLESRIRELGQAQPRRWLPIDPKQGNNHGNRPAQNERCCLLRNPAAEEMDPEDTLS
jgi:hypothetical protein